MERSLTERVDSLRQTMNDPAYVFSALRSDQASSHVQPDQPTADGHEMQVNHVQAKGTEMVETQDTGASGSSSSSRRRSGSRGSDRGSSDQESSRTRMDKSHKLAVREEIGWRLEVKQLYSTKKNEDGAQVFTSWAPPELKFKQELHETTDDKMDTFAIILRHTLQEGGIHEYSTIIQNRRLKDQLAVIFKEYPRIDTKAPKLEFAPGLEPFVHEWDSLLAAERDEDDEKGKTLLRLLIDTLSSELQDSFHAHREFQATGYIDYAHILLVYRPGDIIVRSKQGTLSAGRLKEAYKIRRSFANYLVLVVDVLDWDGKRRGYRQKKWRIDAFEGLQRTADTDYFPLDTHSERGQIRHHLLERGRIFEGLCGRHMQNFRGHVKDNRSRHDHDSNGTLYLSERVIVDAKAYYLFYGSEPELAPLDGNKQSILPAPATSSVSAVEGGTSAPELPPLKEVELMLTVPNVTGFALESKTWNKFHIQSLTPVSWNDAIFDNLVLEVKEKKLLLALISRHGSSKKSFDDFVLGKGKGMILLLGGSPGVGKTLTAEAVAEKLRRPLYRIRAGDLGVEAGKVETALQKAFRHCSYWKAVLLIDEADIFLEQRTSDHLARNELVSIFLVLLEYYQGVLILTSNRTDQLDAAFESRIDIVLSYPSLTPAARRDIWSNFVRALPAGEVCISGEDLSVLSQRELNGRQIKSAVKTAQVLAMQQREPLGMQHLEVVLSIREKGTRLLHLEKRSGRPGWVKDISWLWWCLLWVLPVHILAIAYLIFI